jgi:predicted amidohydrolase
MEGKPMEPVMVACIQQRMRITETPQDFETEARRFLHQAQAKAAQIVIFPELIGLMLAPALISSFKLGFIKREARGKQPGAGFWSQSLGRVAGSTAGALGGGFRGSLTRLLDKNSDAFRDVYFETLGRLAREYQMSILGGSIYLYDPETESVRHRAYLFDVDGEVVGHQDKLNLAYQEQGLATPGSDLAVLESRFGRIGVLIGQDVMYPELARLLAVQGADLLVGIAATPGSAVGRMIRRALALRVEENQVFGATSFLLGPNLLGQENAEDYCGQSALLAPISMTPKGEGVLIQTGTDRTEGIISAELNMDELYELRRTSRFRPRQEINLGNMGPVLAEMYQQGWSIDEAMERHVAGPAGPVAEPLEIEAEPLPEAVEPALEPPVSSEPEPSVPDAMSLTESGSTES